jgi:hypothetical protein
MMPKKSQTGHAAQTAQMPAKKVNTRELKLETPRPLKSNDSSPPGILLCSRSVVVRSFCCNGSHSFLLLLLINLIHLSQLLSPSHATSRRFRTSCFEPQLLTNPANRMSENGWNLSSLRVTIQAWHLIMPPSTTPMHPAIRASTAYST